MDMNILLMGSINMDVAVRLPRIPVINDVLYSDEFKLNLGGKGTNAAVACSRLGLNSYMLGAVGNDFVGSEMLNVLGGEKVNVYYVVRKNDVETGSTIVEVDESAKNVIIVNKGANYAIKKSDVDKVFNDIDSGKLNIDLVYTSLEPEEGLVEYLITESKKRNLPVFCDAAPRPTKKIIDLFGLIDFVVPNQKEAQIITGIEVNDIESGFMALTKIRGMGGNNIIITMSKQGAVFLEKGSTQPEFVEAEKVEAVDETAAGDAFRAAFCVKFLERKNVLESVRFANKAGALAATKFGAYQSMPTIAEIEGY